MNLLDCLMDRHKRTARHRTSLDAVHYALIAACLILAAAGWYAACQASQARREADKVRAEYINLWHQWQDAPMPVDHNK